MNDYDKQRAALQGASAQLQSAEKKVFGGFTGWITRLFMGKRFTDDMKGVMAEGQGAIAQAQVHMAQAKMQQRALAQGVQGFAAPNPFGGAQGYDPAAAANPYAAAQAYGAGAANPYGGQAYNAALGVAAAMAQPVPPPANDPAMQPIAGISLERYADLGAAVADLGNDRQRIAQVLQQERVNPADFEAATTGWTARMQDMALMGRIATAYMPLYQAALARRKGGAASASYEDFVAVSAAIKVFGFEAAMQASGVSQSDWTEVAAVWNETMSRDQPRFANHFGFVGQEEARLRAGGQPKRAQVSRGGGAAPAAQPVAAPAPPAPAPVAASAAIAVGARVTVAWSDGNRYPGKVNQVAQGQYLVGFENGSQQWVPESHVQPA